MPKLPTSSNMSTAIPTQTGNTIPQMRTGMEADAMAQVAGRIARQATQQLAFEQRKDFYEQQKAEKAAKEKQAEFEKAAKEKQDKLDRINFNSALSQMQRENQMNQSEISQMDDYNGFKGEYQKRFGKTYDKYAALVPENYRLDFQAKANDFYYSGEDKLSGIATEKQMDKVKASIITMRDNSLQTLEYSTDPKEMQDATSYFIDSVNASPAYDEKTKAEMIVSFKKEARKIQQDRTIQELSGLSDDEFSASFKVDTKNEVGGVISDKFTKYGMKPEFGMKMAMLESGGRVDAKNPNSSAEGVFQFIKETAKKYNVDVKDPASSADGAARLARDNKKTLEKNGVKVQDWHLYLAHQQGAGGASALLNNPDKNIVEVLTGVYAKNPKIKDPQKRAEQAVKLNGGNLGMTAREFSYKWKRKYEQADISKFAAYTPTDKRAASLLSNLPHDEAYKIVNKRSKSIEKKQFNKTVEDISETIVETYQDDYAGQIAAIDNSDMTLEQKDAVRIRINKKNAEYEKIKKSESEKALKEASVFVAGGGLISELDDELLDNLIASDMRTLQGLEKSNLEKIKIQNDFVSAPVGSDDHKKAVEKMSKSELLPVWSNPETPPMEKAAAGVRFMAQAKGKLPKELSNVLTSITRTPDPAQGQMVAMFVEGLKMMDDRSALESLPDDVRNYAEIFQMNATLPPAEAARIAHETINPDNVTVKARQDKFDAAFKENEITLDNVLAEYGDQETFFSDVFSDARDLSDMAADNPQAIEMADEFQRIMRQEYTRTNDMELAAKNANEKILQKGWGRDFDGRWMKYAPSALYKVNPEFVEKDFNDTLTQSEMNPLDGEYTIFATMMTQKQVMRGDAPKYLIMKDGLPVRDKNNSLVFYTPDADNLKKQQTAFDNKNIDERDKKAAMRKAHEDRKVLIDLKRRAKRFGVSVQELAKLEDEALKEAEKTSKETKKNIANLFSPYAAFEKDMN